MSNFTTQDKSLASGEGFQDYAAASASKVGPPPKESRVEKLPNIRNVSIMGSMRDERLSIYDQ